MKWNEFIYVVLYLNPTCVFPPYIMHANNDNSKHFHPVKEPIRCRELQKLNMKEEKNGDMLLTNDIKR